MTMTVTSSMRTWNHVIGCALLLSLAPSLHSEVVTFTESGCELDLQVEEITADRVTARMNRADIVRLRLGVSAGEPFGDRLLSSRCATEINVQLVTMSQEWVTLVLPRQIIAALDAVGETPVSTEAKIDSPPSRTPPLLRTEVERLAQEMADFKAQAAAQERLFEANIEQAVYGSLRGRLLSNGKPYSGAPVKVRRLPTVSGGEADNKTSPQLFETVTDIQGNFRFEQLPEGPYDIYWIPPQRGYWVRRLTQGPSTVIRAGQVRAVSDINTDMVVVN